MHKLKNGTEASKRMEKKYEIHTDRPCRLSAQQDLFRREYQSHPSKDKTKKNENNPIIKLRNSILNSWVMTDKYNYITFIQNRLKHTPWTDH